MPQKKWQKLSFVKKHTVTNRKRKLFFSQTIKSTALFIFTVAILLYIYTLKNKSHTLYINPLGKIDRFSYVDDTATTETRLKKILETAAISVAAIDIASDSALIVKNSNGEIYTFSQKKNLLQQTASLQRIKTQLTIEGKRLKTADFRFDDPVITLF